MYMYNIIYIDAFSKESHVKEPQVPDLWFIGWINCYNKKNTYFMFNVFHLVHYMLPDKLNKVHRYDSCLQCFHNWHNDRGDIYY